MKIRVKILSRFEDSVLPSVEQAMQRALPKLSSYVVDRLSMKADDKLKTTAHEYKRGLEQPDSIDISETGFTVRLIGAIPEALENGFDAFDIKTQMLRSPSAKQGKEGLYVDVPFRHGADSKSVRFRGMPTDIKQQVQSALRREQRAAKRESRQVGTVRTRGRTPGVERVQKLRFGAITQDVVTRTKQGIYDNMIRTVLQVGRRSVAQYRTIRRISGKSERTAWWHPGFEGVQGIREVSKNIEAVAKNILVDELKKEGLDAK